MQKGKKLITGSEDKKIKVWDLNNLRTSSRRTKPVSFSFKGHTASVQCLALMPGERMVFSGSTDKTIRMWDLESKSRKCSRVFEGHEHTVTSLCAPFATDNELSNRVISGSLDGNVRIWDIERGSAVATLKVRTELDIYRTLLIICNNRDTSGVYLVLKSRRIS